MELKKGKIYIGKINTEPVVYTGYKIIDSFFNHDIYGHTFQYVKPKNKYVVGYNQDIQEVEKEEYRLDITGTILYGK